MKTFLVANYSDASEDLLQYVSSSTRDQQKAQIAQYDFSGDGQPGYLLYIEGVGAKEGYQGYVEAFDKLGKYYLRLEVKNNLCALRPNGNGIQAENGQIKGFTTNLQFDPLYTQFLEFKTFIQRFSTDKAFQLSRIKFPIVWQEYINGETKPKRQTSANWRHASVLKSSGPGYEIFINYPSAKKPSEASISETCAKGDCGYGAGLGFKRINGVWYCVSKWFGSD